MLSEDVCFAMPPLATWFHGREAMKVFLAGWPMSGAWQWKGILTTANGQPALAFYTWDEDEQAYLPFALNVLTLRGNEISDVVAFINRATDADPAERERYYRFVDEPTDPDRLLSTFGRFNMPERLEATSS
jgi:RNA polymerase sigma-70 factor (ECF subfamily)